MGFQTFILYSYVKYVEHISVTITIIINYLYYSSLKPSFWNSSVVYWVAVWWFSFVLVGPKGSDKKWSAMEMEVPGESGMFYSSTRNYVVYF